MPLNPHLGQVVLRDVADGDIDFFFECQTDEEAVAMVAMPPRDREAHDAHWAKILADDATVNKAIEVDGQLVGNVASWENEGKRLVGYFIAKTHWGKGIATAALAELLEEVAGRPLYAYVATHNIGSTRVLEKCGFTVVEGSLHVGNDGVEEVLMKVDG